MNRLFHPQGFCAAALRIFSALFVLSKYCFIKGSKLALRSWLRQYLLFLLRFLMPITIILLLFFNLIMNIIEFQKCPYKHVIIRFSIVLFQLMT